MLREMVVLAQVVSFVAMASELGTFGSRGGCAKSARVVDESSGCEGGGGCEYLSGRRMRLMRWYW